MYSITPSNVREVIAAAQVLLMSLKMTNCHAQSRCHLAYHLVDLHAISTFPRRTQFLTMLSN